MLSIYRKSSKHIDCRGICFCFKFLITVWSNYSERRPAKILQPSGYAHVYVETYWYLTVLRICLRIRACSCKSCVKHGQCEVCVELLYCKRYNWKAYGNKWNDHCSEYINWCKHLLSWYVNGFNVCIYLQLIVNSLWVLDLPEIFDEKCDNLGFWSQVFGNVIVTLRAVSFLCLFLMHINSKLLFSLSIVRTDLIIIIIIIIIIVIIIILTRELTTCALQTCGVMFWDLSSFSGCALSFMVVCQDIKKAVLKGM